MINADHLAALINCPDSKKTAEYGVAVFAQDAIVIMRDLQEHGLVQFHPEGSQIPGSEKPDPSWTRTRAGDMAIQVVLNHINAYLSGV